jgi:hypothetical protein
MSIFNVPVAQTLPILVVVSGSSATTIVDATDAQIIVPWFEVNEHFGGTHDLTVDIIDAAAVVTYLGDDAGATWNVKAVTAKASYKFNKGYVVPKGGKLRVTSSDAAGKFHVIGIQLPVV